jgi:hypothetical protein
MGARRSVWSRVLRPLGCGAAIWAFLARATAADPGSCPYQGPFLETICQLGAITPEDRDLRPEAYFFEPSKVLLLPQHGGTSDTGNQDNLAVEVEFNETIFPFQNRATPRDRHFGGFSTAVGLTPMYRVRIWKERSAPVRTPSFMPKGTFQLNYLGPRKLGEQWGGRPGGGGTVRMATIMATIGHHSNGQDGCLYADSEGNAFPPGELCPEDPPEIRINRLNGSFSTNYVQLSSYLTFFRLSSQSTLQDKARSRPGVWDDERRAAGAGFVGVTYEYNIPFDFLGGAIEKAVRPIYGMNRLRVTAGYRRYPDRIHPDRRKLPRPQFRVSAWLEVTDKREDSADCGVVGGTGYEAGPCAPQLGWGADINVGLGSRVDYLGLYGRFYHGQDYYNLSFTHRKANSLQVGLSFSPGRSRGPTFPTFSDRLIQEELACAKAGEGDSYREYVRNAARKVGKGETPKTKPAPLCAAPP